MVGHPYRNILCNLGILCIYSYIGFMMLKMSIRLNNGFGRTFQTISMSLQTKLYCRLYVDVKDLDSIKQWFWSDISNTICLKTKLFS